MNAPATGKKVVTAMDRIDEMLAKMSPEELKKLDKIAAEELAKPWLPTPGPQLDAYLSRANLLLYGGAAGGGKGSALDSMVLTPFGFRVMGSLKVGSAICSPDGSVSQVLQIFPLGVRQLFKVSFHDGTSTEVTDDHIWLAWRRNGTKANGERRHGEESARLWTTAELLTKVSGGQRFSTPITFPVAFTDVSRYERRPVDPYLLGVLLGDGSITKKALRISCGDHEIVERVQKLGTRLYGPYAYEGRVDEYRLPEPNDVRRHLEKWDLVGKGSAEKFIPDAYLVGSVEQRWELLRGLMDTDGWCDKDGDIYYCTISPALRDDVRTLAGSLGALVTVREKFARAQNGNGSLAFTLRLKFRDGSMAFSLERKAALANKTPQSMGRVIVSIEPTRETEAQCIKVSHPSGLYLTNDFIVTHNTDLICGLALTEHKRAVVFRSQSTDLNGFWERLEILCPQTTSRNSNLKRMVTLDQRMIECGHLDGPGSERAWQGRRHDLCAFDEAATIDARKINFVLGWLAPSEDAPHCRAILATNPPIGAEGAYLMEWFAPWLDPFYPNPAQTGELRWSVAVGDESEIKTIWVDGPETIYLNADLSWRLATQEEIDERPRLKQINKPLSRTFIPALLDDNPYLRDTDYRSQLQAKPEPLRSQLLHGSFLAGREDDEWQLIPSEWIRAAQKRWQAPRGKVMIAMGVDVAQGGIHKSTIAPLYDGNVFDKVLSWPGVETPDGKSLADKIILYRRDGANIAVDMTGGYGGSARDHLWHNHQIKIFPIVFSAAGPGGDPQTGYSFFNLRAKMYWQFRIALDPSKSGTAGHVDIALPPGDRILAQLAAPRWKPRSGKIVIEAKEDIQERLGSSPDEADAIVEAWHVRNMKTKALSEGSSNHRSLGEFNSRSARLSWMG